TRALPRREEVEDRGGHAPARSRQGRAGPVRLAVPAALRVGDQPEPLDEALHRPGSVATLGGHRHRPTPRGGVDARHPSPLSTPFVRLLAPSTTTTTTREAGRSVVCASVA